MNTPVLHWLLSAFLVLSVSSLTAQECATLATRVAIDDHPVVVEEGSLRAKLAVVQLQGEPVTFPLNGELPAAGASGSAYAYRSRSDGMGCRSILFAPGEAIQLVPTEVFTLQPDASSVVTFSFDGLPTERIDDISLSLFRDFYDPALDNCPRLVAASFEEAGNRTELTAELTAGQTYVLVVQPGQSPDWSYARDFSIRVRSDEQEAPRFYTGGRLPPGTHYTYLAVTDDASATVAAVSDTGDFTSLEAGAYVVYGLHYGGEGTDPGEVMGLTVEEAERYVAEGCMQLSENGVGGLLIVRSDP